MSVEFDELAKARENPSEEMSSKCFFIVFCNWFLIVCGL